MYCAEDVESDYSVSDEPSCLKQRQKKRVTAEHTFVKD